MKKEAKRNVHEEEKQSGKPPNHYGKSHCAGQLDYMDLCNFPRLPIARHHLRVIHLQQGV